MPPAAMIAHAAVYSRRMTGLGISLPFVPTFASDEFAALVREVEARGGTVRELLDDLTARFPALRGQLLEDDEVETDLPISSFSFFNCSNTD